MSAERDAARVRKSGGRLRVDRVYPHPPSLVWRALTEQELLSRWLMPNDFRAEVGAAFTFQTEPGPGFDGIVRCEVLTLDAPNRMEWSWRGGPLDTTVCFELEPLGDGQTRLIVTHSGFRGARARLVKWILGIGNRTMYGKRLPQLLDDQSQARSGQAVVTSAMRSPIACLSIRQRFVIAMQRILPKRRS